MYIKVATVLKLQQTKMHTQINVGSNSFQNAQIGIYQAQNGDNLSGRFNKKKVYWSYINGANIASKY